MKKVSLYAAIATLMLAACGEKKTYEKGSDIHIVTTESDSTRYGIYLRSVGDSLQWVSEEGDTAWLNTHNAKMFGQFEMGNRLAVLFKEGSHRDLYNVIDMSQLMGRWVEPDAVDEGMMQGFELQEGGAASSINSRSGHYVSWRVYNGKILLTNTMDGFVDQDLPEDTLHLLFLSQDSLRVQTAFDKHAYRRSNGENDDKVSEYESYESPDMATSSDLFNPEGEAPAERSPHLPAEDQMY